MGSRVRYALYFTPDPDSALARFGEDVLRACTLPGLDQRARDALTALTVEPRLYGFHATLRAPMRLATDSLEEEFIEACTALAQHRRPVPVGRLAIAQIGDFIALVPTVPTPELDLFAAECVAGLDRLRAPLTPAEQARRHPDRLDARGRALLDRWGYPHVFEAFRFHMTLTGRLAAEESALWLRRLSQAYEAEPRLVIDAVTVLRQDGDAPFRPLRRIPFTA